MKSDEDNKDEDNIEVTYKDMFNFITPYFKGRVFPMFISFLLIVISITLGAIIPIYIGNIVDFMIDANTNIDDKWQNIWSAFWMIVVLKASSSLIKSIGSVLIHIYDTKMMTEVAADAVYKVQRFSSQWHADSFVGGTMRKISRAMWTPMDIAYYIVIGLTPAVTMLIAMEVIVAIKLPTVAIVLGIIMIIYTSINLFAVLKITRPAFKDMFKEDNEFNSSVSDLITGNEIVKSFSAERCEDKNIGKILKKFRDKCFYAFASTAVMEGVRAWLDLLIYASSLAVVVWMWKDGRATPGDIAFIISAVAIITGYLSTMGNNIAGIQRTFNSMEDAVGLWLREEDIADKPNAKKLVISESAIEDKIVFNNINFAYPKTKKDIFKNLSINIKNGEKIALVGTSGSGKSTFIKLMQRLYNLDSGAIYIEGQDISEVTLESLRQSISLVPQDPILFHRTLRENIAYGKADTSMEEIISAAKKAHAHEFIEGLSKGYDTLVGERGIKLSGGERQRVAIARAILADKAILVLDEATSSLDSVSESYIKEAIDVLTKDKTTITIAHRLSTIKNSDRILVFENGEIIEQGKHEELMSDEDSKYRKLYETQSLGIIIEEDDIEAI